MLFLICEPVLPFSWFFPSAQEDVCSGDLRINEPFLKDIAPPAPAPKPFSQLMEEKARHMCWSSGKFCWAFGCAQEAFLEAGMFNLFQVNTLASMGGWVSLERNVLTEGLLSLGLHLRLFGSSWYKGPAYFHHLHPHG